MKQTQRPQLDHDIVTMIADLCAISPTEIKDDDRLREDLGMDSVSSMELLSMLAENMQLEIEMEEAIGVTTVSEIIEMARSRLEARA